MLDLLAKIPARVLLAAFFSGVTLALVVYLVLSSLGLELAGLWQPVPTAQSGGAAAWWMITGIAFATSWAVTMAMTRPSWELGPIWQFVGGTAAVIVVFGLTTITHWASVPKGMSVLNYVAASFTVLFLGSLMAAIGIFFAMRK